MSFVVVFGAISENLFVKIGKIQELALSTSWSPRLWLTFVIQ